MSYEQCIRKSWIDRSLTRPPCKILLSTLHPQKTPSRLIWCRNCRPVAMNILLQLWTCLFCYLFAYPTSNQDAKTFAKNIIIIMTKHAYLPITLISDKGTAFMSHVIKEVAGVLGITLKHLTTNHAQTIGMLERFHTSIKQALKIETGERRSLWHNYVSLAVLNYNTSHHTSIGCEPSRVLHECIP